jgi:hypothetical protein
MFSLLGVALGILVPYFYLEWLVRQATLPGAPDAQLEFAMRLISGRLFFYGIFGAFGAAFGLWFGIRFTLSAFQRRERSIHEKYRELPQ